MWDSQALTCLRTLEGHEDNVRVLAVGDSYVFSGSWDKSIRFAPATHWHPSPHAWDKSIQSASAILVLSSP